MVATRWLVVIRGPATVFSCGHAGAHRDGSASLGTADQSPLSMTDGGQSWSSQERWPDIEP